MACALKVNIKEMEDEEITFRKDDMKIQDEEPTKKNEYDEYMEEPKKAENNLILQDIFFQNKSIIESNNKILDKLNGLESKTEKLEKNCRDTNQKIIEIVSNMETMKGNVNGVMDSQKLINSEFEENIKKMKKTRKRYQ